MEGIVMQNSACRGRTSYWNVTIAGRNRKIMYFSNGQKKDRDAAASAGVKCIYGPNGYTKAIGRIIQRNEGKW